MTQQRNTLYVPMRNGVMLKDKDDPVKSVGASLRGNTIHVHWADGFTPDEVKHALKPWWPLATKVEFPK